jgi:phospholipase C
VTAGSEVQDEWKLEDFDNGQYRLRVYGPNGFYREFAGHEQEPGIHVACGYERSKINPKKLTGNISLAFTNNESTTQAITVRDNSYKTGSQKKMLSPGSLVTMGFNLEKSYGWYDFSVIVSGDDQFEKRFAGHVETGNISRTDPLMGQVI